MKRINHPKFLLIILIIVSRLSTNGQGTVNFANRVGISVDAPVTYEDGTPVGPNFQAQLLAGKEGADLSLLKPVLPTTPFRADRLGYIAPIVLSVPGIPAGAKAVVLMRAFDGSTWEESNYRGESNPVTVVLANGAVPPDLIGLQSFHVYAVPEPCAAALLVFGFGLLCEWRSRHKKAFSTQ